MLVLENLRLRHQTAAEADGLVEQLVDVYLDAHADDGPRYTAARYEQQLAAHMPREGWELVAARVDDDLVGYAYGFPLGSDSHWWDGIHEPVPDGFTDEDGQRTYAVCELLVRRSWQRRGIARALHDRLLSTRREEGPRCSYDPTTLPPSRRMTPGVGNRPDGSGPRGREHCCSRSASKPLRRAGDGQRVDLHL
ncbi:GNAT family N-acetyltransferase [Micromonospora sp. BRA006-A]|nr:GNAT family N-acetyltransferase [Micromonospora sp. BRA006-A]